MLFDVLNRVANELPGCLLTSVVDRESGLALASVSPGTEDAAAADAFHSQMYRVLGTALEELGVDAPVDDVVVQGFRNVFVSSPLGDSGYFWHIVTENGTTLGFTQAVMRKYRAEVEEGIEALVS